MSTQSSERNNMDSKQEFKLFPNLPMELRKMIWHFTLEPRLVSVSCGSFCHENISRPSSCKGFFTNTPPPPALSVCQDSREAIIGSYPLRFGGAFTSPKIRFNSDIDTLFLNDDMDPHYALFFNSLRIKDLTCLKRLAVSDIAESYVQPWRIESVPGGYVVKRYGILDVVVPQMKNLEEIYNVQIPTNEMEDDVPSGQGPMQLFDKLPKGLLEKGYGYDYVSDSLVEDPPRGLFDLAGVKVIEVWGWCPTKEWLKHGYVKDI